MALLLFLGWLRPIAAEAPRTERYPRDARPFAALYDPPSRPLELVMNSGDGQAFAAIGRDPLLGDPDVFWEGPEEAAYRAQRPLFGWLAFASAGGQKERVPEALVAWTVIGVGLLVGAVARTLQRSGRITWLAMYLIGAPGVLAVLRTVGPEPLGCGLAVLAIARWKTHRWQAVACFTLAVLCRETLLLVPLVLAVHGLVSERRLRPQLPLLVPPAVLAAWIGFMRLRTGAWPTEASDGRVGMGFSGLVEAADALDPSDIAALLLFAAIAVAVVVRARTTVAGGIVLAHVLLASVLGEAVWLRWNDFGRVLLPLVVFGLLALAPGTVEVPADERSERPDGVPVHPGELLGAPVR
jgi:hypothetical protein